MWNLCRPAALAQLQRAATRMPVLCAASAAFDARFTRGFATKSSIAGVEMDHLLNSSSRELAAELGKDKIAQVHRALTEEFADVIGGDEDVTAEEVVQIFSAAQKTRLPTLMLRAFAYMKDHFPDDIDFVMFGEVFRLLSRERNGAKMLEVYEFARPRFEPAVPELIYRFGIVGNIESGDMDHAQQLVEAMQNDGHFVNNEIVSRLINGHAQNKNVDQVVELYESLDPTNGHWHESAVDRIILSLGVVGKPDLAFEFYVNSNMKLNGGTLITLLSVCRHNDCRQQAADILENRKRFSLKLDARAYNGILQTLEFLDRHDDLAAVLEEMGDEGVRFDTRTKQIVQRNQDALKGTYFDLDLARERSLANRSEKFGDQASQKKTKKKLSAYKAMPELKVLVAEERFAEAAAFADQFVRPLTLEDLAEDKRADAEIAEGALRVTPSIAREAVLAFIGTNDLDKIDGLISGFAHAESRVGFALLEIMLAFSEEDKRGRNARPPQKKLTRKQNELAYRAVKTMVQLNWPIYRVTHALHLFRQFEDSAAACQLCEHILEQYAQQDKQAPKQAFSAATVSQTLVWTLRTLGETNDIAGALDLIDKAEQTGFRVQSSHYTGLLTGMRPHSSHSARQKGVVVLTEDYRQRDFYYTSDEFEAVLNDMETRGVPVTRGVVANVCFALAGGDKIQRTRLLEAYASATLPVDPNARMQDKFVMPTVVYSVLLQLAGRESRDMILLKQIYKDALESLPENQRVPLDWEIVMISHLADAGLVEEASVRLENMMETCGSYSYEAAVKVLRGGLATKHDGAVETAVSLLDKRNFKLTLTDAYDLVHLAREAGNVDAAFEVVTLYERAHGNSTAGVVDHANSRQSARDKYAVRKIRSMYRIVLKLCEESGQWKRALTFSNRVNELLRFDKSDADGALDKEDDVEVEAQSDRRDE